MFRPLLVLASLLLAAPAFASGAAAPNSMKYLYEYGYALFHAHQDRWFDAIALLDAARPSPAEALAGAGAGTPAARPERIAGNFELSYRMDNRAGRAIEGVIEGTARDEQRNEALFRLAGMYFRKDQPRKAFQAVERVRGDVPREVRSDLAFLRANIYLANDRSKEAVSILKGLQDEKGLEGFSSYNLGIALLRTGDQEAGRASLDRAGRVKSDDRAALAIRDKANLVLGELLLDGSRAEAAKEVLDRVRLDGPFSNRALLSSGWADASRDRYDAALAPWSLLAERGIGDPAVQEALLAVPFAYGRLGVYGTAALRYETALKAFGAEIARLDASIAGIRDGAFLRGLLREELRQGADRVERLRELPRTPETSSLLELMASNDFQESLKNYLDIEELRRKLDTWSGDLDAFEDLIRKRRAHFARLLPGVNREIARLAEERRSLAERRDRIAGRLKAIRTEPRPELLITAEERSALAQLASLESVVTSKTREIAPKFLERLRRLRGVLHWNIHTDYDRRHAATGDRLQDLDRELDRLHGMVTAVTLARRTAVEGYEGHDDVIRRERQRIAETRKKVLALIARQGQVLEVMAVNELTGRRDRLEELRTKARFALADSYDRAGKAARERKTDAD